MWGQDRYVERRSLPLAAQVVLPLAAQVALPLAAQVAMGQQRLLVQQQLQALKLALPLAEVLQLGARLSVGLRSQSSQ